MTPLLGGQGARMAADAGCKQQRGGAEIRRPGVSGAKFAVAALLVACVAGSASAGDGSIEKRGALTRAGERQRKDSSFLAVLRSARPCVPRAPFPPARMHGLKLRS